MVTCSWCHRSGTMTIHSAKYGRAFCNRRCFGSWKFYHENYCAPLFDLGGIFRWLFGRKR